MKRDFAILVLVIAGLVIAEPSLVSGADRLTCFARAGATIWNPQPDKVAGIEFDREIDVRFTLSAIYSLHAEFALQMDLSYAAAGISRRYALELWEGQALFQEQVTLHYLEWSGLARFPFPPQGFLTPSVYAGPSLLISLGGTNNVSYEPAVGTVDFAPGSVSGDVGNVDALNLGFVIGIDFLFRMAGSTLQLDLRYRWEPASPFSAEGEYPYALDGNLPFVGPFSSQPPDVRLDGLSLTLGLELPI